MNRIGLLAPALLLSGIASAPALALGRLADVTLTDRDSSASGRSSIPKPHSCFSRSIASTAMA